MEDTLYWLIFHGVRHCTGLAANTRYRKAKADFNKDPRNKCWRCSLCDKNIKKSQRSIDHIIPSKIIFDLDRPELVELLFDPRNFRAAHKSCNELRGVLTVEDLPAKVRDMLICALDKKQI